MKTLIIGYNGLVASKVISLFNNKNIRITTSNQNNVNESENIYYFDMFSNSNNYDKLLNDVDQILFVWPSKILSYNEKIELFFKKIKQYKIQKIVFISALDADKSKNSIYNKIEILIKNTNINYTFLRCNMFMQNLLTTHKTQIVNNELFIPARNAKISFIDAMDVAKVCYLILTNIKDHNNKVYNLTGQESLTFNQISMIMSKVLNKNIVYTKPFSFQYKKVMLQKQMDKKLIKEILTLYLFAKLGFMKKIYPDLKILLDNKTSSFENFIKNNKDKF